MEYLKGLYSFTLLLMPIILRGASILSHFDKTFGIINHNNLSPHGHKDAPDPSGFSQFAFVAVEGEFYGAKAVMNIWEPPHVQPNEFSLSYLTLIAGPSNNPNIIAVGWHVDPVMYGDHRSRVFVAWSRDNFVSTGCINLRCPGFVQTRNKITLGAPFPNLSTISGIQVEISILIWKEKDAWWIPLNDNILGHWPLSLFTDLANNATGVAWGGNVLNSHSGGQPSTTTQMGSCHFPEEGIGKASYMRQLHVVDKTMTLKSLSSPQNFAQQPNCYNITFGRNDLFGDFIFYGGPGRNPKCP